MVYEGIHNAKFVPHLKTGDSADVESWNNLYSEMDKRVSTATNGRSILFLNTKNVEEFNWAGYGALYWDTFRGTNASKLNDDPNSEKGIIGDRQFYFTSGAVTGDDGEYPYTLPQCKRCEGDNWLKFDYANQQECQKINCNFSLANNAGWYWKLWGKFFLEDQTHVNWLYKHEYFENTVSGSYIIDVNHERNVALVIEAENYYTRNRGRETPIFSEVINRSSEELGGLLSYNSPATCPQSPFLYCQNLDNSLGVHILSDNHPREYISIDCLHSSISGSLSGVNSSTGFFTNASGTTGATGDCPDCINGSWLTHSFGFYSEAECVEYFGCTSEGGPSSQETGYTDVCPSGVYGPEDLKLSGKRIISYGNWAYTNHLGWAEDKLLDSSEEKIIPNLNDPTYINHGNLNSENRSSQAELFFEGYKSEYQNFIFPKEWNKYKFFRIHNLNNYDMNFTFESELSQSASGVGDGNFADGDDVYAVSECGAGTGLELSIKAGESRCIRRDFGIYTTGFNHFQKFVRGDEKYSFNLGLMGSTTAAYPLYSNPYVKSEESNWRDFTNNVNNPFILGRYYNLLKQENRILVDETWPRTWDGYHTYVDTYNEEAPPIHLAFSGYLPWSRLRQPKRYSYEDFNPYNPETILADLIYTTGYALRSTSIRSGEITHNPYAGTSAGFANSQLFEINANVDQVEYALNLSLIPYSGARYLEQFLHQLGVNLFPHDPNVGWTTPRSTYGAQVAMFGHGWSGMFSGPRRMLAGEELYYEPKRMVSQLCVPSSPGADIGLRDLLDEEQKSRGMNPLKQEYIFLDDEGTEAGLPSVLNDTKGSVLSGFYGWKLGYAGTWERYTKDKIIHTFDSGISGDQSVSGSGDESAGIRYTAGYRADGVTGSGDSSLESGGYYHFVGEQDNNPDNISCISGMRKKLFKNWYSDSSWFARTSSNIDPPDPFAWQIQAMPVSTNLFGRDNAFNNIMQLYPIPRLKLDATCQCHEQHIVPMIDTIFGHNINIGDYYFQLSPRVQTRRGDTIDLEGKGNVAGDLLGNADERKARNTFKIGEDYTPVNNGFWNHYKYAHPTSGPKAGSNGNSSDSMSKCYPYYSSRDGGDVGFGGEYPFLSGTRYKDDAGWFGATSESPHCPVFIDIDSNNPHAYTAASYYKYNTSTGMPMDLVEVTPYYKPVFYADPKPFRLWHGEDSPGIRWVGVDDSYLTINLDPLNEVSIIRNCHECDSVYDSLGNQDLDCVCNDVEGGYGDTEVGLYHAKAEYGYINGNGPINSPIKSRYLPVHIDYLDETQKVRNFKSVSNAIMPLHYGKDRSLSFDQNVDGRGNHRSFFQTTIYDLQEVFGEFNKITGHWTGYRAFNDGLYSWGYAGEIPRATKVIDYNPVMRITRPGPHYGEMMSQMDVGSGSPTGAVDQYKFTFTGAVSGINFNEKLKTFMEPTVIAMSNNDPFKFHPEDGGIGYANIRFADGASVKYDIQKNVNLFSINREPIYAFPTSSASFSQGMQVDPDVSGYPEGSPILRMRHSFGLDKYNEMYCNRSAVSAGKGDNSYFSRGATNTLDGGYLNINFRNALSTFTQTNRTPEFYSAMIPATENLYNTGLFGANMLAESGYKYLHPDVFSSEHMKELRVTKGKNRPIGGWNNENLFQKYIFGFPRFFQWMDYHPAQVDAKSDYLDVPTNYGVDTILSQFGPPVGIYVLEQTCEKVEYSEDCIGFDSKEIGEDASGNAINDSYKGLISLPEGTGYWKECASYYENLMSGDIHGSSYGPTQADHDHFSKYCPKIEIKDWLLRTGDPFFFQINPYCDGSHGLNESWVKAYPYLDTGKDGETAVIKGGIVVGTGVWHMFPPKIDLIQPLEWPPAELDFNASWSSAPIIVDSNHPSGKDANIYPYFSGYPEIPWVESLCVSGIVTEVQSDFGNYNQTSNLFLDYFINNQFGVRRMDKYPCYGDILPTCPHDVLVEL